MGGRLAPSSDQENVETLLREVPVGCEHLVQFAGTHGEHREAVGEAVGLVRPS